MSQATEQEQKALDFRQAAHDEQQHSLHLQIALEACQEELSVMQVIQTV